MSTPASHDNFTLKEEIRAYWSARAESFDLSFGHAIKSDRELKAFQRLIGDSFGPEPLDVLDLACGTGEITRALLSLKHRVTALDFSEAMLERARAKHGKAARFRLGDAERLLDEDASYDAAITRHLVWTLTDPEAALSEWFRVLRPGGRLLIIDGDWVNRTRWQALVNRFGTWLRAKRGAAVHQIDADTHASITSRFYFKDGLSRPRLEAMLTAAGFTDIVSADYHQVVREQQRAAPLHDAIRLASSTRFALLARKPADAAVSR
jgi:ubiquinone/menaquinone biosynthesis C-methylase UbiE